jgi:hypothetical protein
LLLGSGAAAAKAAFFTSTIALIVLAIARLARQRPPL